MPGAGLASLGTLAAERGLELVKREGDPERLARQFEQLRSEAGGRKDRSDAPAHAVEQLKAALREDFGPPSSTGIAELAHRLVPELTSTRVKTLPRMPGPAALAELARRARALPRGALKPVSAFLPPLPVAPAGPKVGRNEPCPCGSGKKYKSCCLGTSP